MCRSVYGGPQLSRQNKIQNNKFKLLPANYKHSWQKQKQSTLFRIPHGKSKSLTAKAKAVVSGFWSAVAERELTFPTTRAEIVAFLEAKSAFWAKHDDYVSEESGKTSRSCGSCRVTPRTWATADQKPLTTVLAFAVSNLLLPWAICFCREQFPLVMTNSG